MKIDFDQIASTWDRDPGRIKLAEDVAAALIKKVALASDMDLLDYGCGTGLLTLALRPFVKCIRGMDSSQGMLDVFTSKIRQQGIENIELQHIDSENAAVNGPFHVIISSMTLHHVQYPDALIMAFFNGLHSGGHLCVADLDPDEGEFHGPVDGVFHAGFERSAMRRFFSMAGFTDIEDITAATISKKSSDNKLRNFTVFLMTGRKP